MPVMVTPPPLVVAAAEASPGQAEEREREFTRGLAEVAASFSTGIWYRRRMERALEKKSHPTFFGEHFSRRFSNIG